MELLPHSVPTWNPTRLDLAGSNLQVGPGRAGLCTCPPSGRPATHPVLHWFLLLPDLQSKNFFYKKFLTFINESKTGLKTGNEIIQTGNGIISPIS